MIKSIERIAALSISKDTLKANKRALAVEYSSCDYESNFDILFESAQICKTKQSFFEATAKIYKKVVDSQEYKALVKATKEQEQEEKALASTTELDELAVIIQTNIEGAMSSTLIIGKVLVRAMDIIKAQGGKQVDFLKWADENCSIGKAQAYKLMSVFNTFGNESAYAKTSMRVLYKLGSQSEKVQEEAIVLADKNKLDTKALDKLIMKHAPIKSLPTPNTPAQSSSPAVQQAIDNGGTLPESGSKELLQVIEGSSSQVIEKQDSTIEELNKVIVELREQLKSVASTTIRRESILPYLPQFDSQEPCTVIGLESAKQTSKTDINKAYRALASIYTKAKAEKAAEKLLIARDSLISAIK